MSLDNYYMQLKYLRKIDRRIKTLESAQKEMQIVIDALKDEQSEIIKNISDICID